MVICIGAGSFAEALDWTAQVYAAAGARLAKRNALQGVADEGGYWPAFKSNEEGLAELVGAIADAGLEPGARRRHRPRHRRHASSFAAAATTSRWRTARSPPGSCTPCCCAGSSAIRSCRSRTRSPSTTRRRCALSRRSGQRASRSSATISSSPMRETGARRRRRLQHGAPQAQPGRHGHRDPRLLGGGAKRPATAPSSRRARARPRTCRSCTSPSAGACRSSRSAASRAPSAWRSGTRPAHRGGAGRQGAALSRAQACSAAE